MTNIPSSRVLYQTLKEVNADVDQMMQEAAQQIGGILAQNAVNGVIPTSRRDLVLDQAGSIIANLFARGRTVYANDGVTPITRYATILNYRIALGIARTIAAHTTYLRRRLPEDLIRWLATARPISQEQVNVTNPLASYDAPHTWVDPNGYRLSDRIWRVGQNTRLKIDALLTDGIRTGRGALQMSQDLEAFLRPTRTLRRTNMPYGTDASYHAMVLARSEISRAASEATFAASRANPFVSGMDWRLSTRHPKVDICDQLATIGMSGERIKDPYPLEGAPMVVQASHPQCCTPGQLVQTARGAIAIEDVREGDHVLTDQGRYCRVLLAWSRQYDGQVYEVTTDSGRFTLTPEHPVLTERGWVNAQDLKPEDKVLHTGFDVAIDHLVSVAEGDPAALRQPLITRSIPFGVMPVQPVTFNVELCSGVGEIQEETANPVFPLEAETVSTQRFIHRDLDAGGADDLSAAHDLQARIMEQLGAGNLRSHFGAFGGVVIPTQIDLGELPHTLPGLGAPSFCVGSLPLHLNCVAVCSQRDADMNQNCAQCSEWDAKTGAKFGGSERGIGVQVGENITDWTIENGFDPQNVVFQDRFCANFSAALHAVFGFSCAGCTAPGANTSGISLSCCLGAAFVVAFSAENAVAQLAALGTSAHSNDLLSSSPDVEVGDRSGNQFVSGVANPTQAHMNYTVIRAVEQKFYSGLVYNMHVGTDNTYTVNGHVVHNCLCANLPAVTESVDDVIASLRADLQAAKPAPLTPVSATPFMRTLVGDYLTSLVSRELLAILGGSV